MTVGNVSTYIDFAPAIALNGNELVLIYQQGNNVTPWITVNCTTGQIANLLNGGVSNTPSMRQLFAAMAFQNVMVSAFEQLPSDITNTYSIAWNHAYRMPINDPFVSGFLQPALGYTGAQMTSLFALALTYPI
jgi:hypothetical protein